MLSLEEQQYCSLEWQKLFIGRNLAGEIVQLRGGNETFI